MGSAVLLGVAATLTCSHLNTQKTIWMTCAEATIQDKKSPDFRTRNPITKTALSS